MRKHGWQLPYHPLQVAAIAVFLALGFAFYVFFAPFVGKQLFQYIAMGFYTPIIVCVFGLYICCAAADPADSGVFRSKKYLHIPDKKKQKVDEPKHEGELGDSTQSIRDANVTGTQENTTHDQSKNSAGWTDDCNNETEKKNPSFHWSYYLFTMSALALCSSYICSCKDSTEQHGSEDGMFYCSLCEVEVFQHSKHCRVCDKCVDCFDHHCRWINNCIGKRNYGMFFTLMVFALLMLILQWSTGILVLILCFLEKKKFAADISYKLGSSFTVVPFAIVVAVCTLLAMVATLPLVQLFCFHVLLIKKGISTYDYIVALREQEQEAAEGQHSPQMSTVSSITGLSSASSFNNFQRAAWCTPPRLFIEDQFDAIPPENASVSSLGKRITVEEPSRKKNRAPIRISPWMLARLNAEEVSRAAAEARKNSKILRPAGRKGSSSALETNNSFGSSRSRTALRLDDGQSRGSSHICLPIPEPTQRMAVDCETVQDHHMITETMGAFRTTQTMSSLVSVDNYSSSPVSSVGSPEIRPLRPSSAGAKAHKEIEIPLSRSNSDGYDASGGEDSDQNPARILHRSVTWSNSIHGSEQFKTALPCVPSSKHREG